MKPGSLGPIPRSAQDGATALDPLAYDACPGKGLSYPSLNEYIYGGLPSNWLVIPQLCDTVYRLNR